MTPLFRSAWTNAKATLLEPGNLCTSGAIRWGGGSGSS